MKVQFQGKEVEATEVDILTQEEHFNTYQLADGHILMFKAVLSGVQRLEGITSPDGMPAYQFQTQNVSRVR